MEKTLNGLFVLCFVGSFLGLVTSGASLAMTFLLVAPVTIATFAALAFVGFLVAVILEKPKEQVDAAHVHEAWIGQTGLQH
ncbi:MAG: hypothetical protein GYB42_12715 [Alphaproteobacteria bacterium]|nr:hypothetical protein [Alphaproteobacteria bacterium]